LRQLDNSSLGSILFSSRGLCRSPFQLARVDGQSQQLPAELQTATELWGRRCRFELQNKPIMVSEIFLPAFRCEPVSGQG
jgi:chorismate--pyruvate lyase